MEQVELTISEFGRRAGLSHKALRLYDVSGLLPPARVDPVTGYRLYDEAQLERARRISMLRQIDMPLSTIAEVLAGTDEEALIRLDRWWAAELATTEARQATLEYLRDRLIRSGSPGLAPRPVLVRDVPETKVASIRVDTDQQGLMGEIVAATIEIRAHLTAVAAELPGGSWVIYHGAVTPENEAAVEICVPFTGLVDPAGPIGIRLEPAHTEAYCTISRDDCVYPRIMLAYDLVDDWVRHTGHPTTGPAREIYHPGFRDLNSSDPAVDIAQPIRPSATTIRFPEGTAR
ncbi:transcriptional regulator, MerR family [Kribbella flavida DSM 17836]|uniref:Transcriptional regulator, MerR family n=1 Tax=Kribbella flavida (strain DSM 17836 / JCM 10339 / NBRC 14399) TaxID=479435 RepID=D2Q207_KRIFD|nr:MerR family transcriptional regulator [Kribbella flavida]ADB33953.1 transcriptional regulator, MerR family [Kribbella flavida DSM 17836]